MRYLKQACWIITLCLMALTLTLPAAAENIFEKEVEKEAAAVKLLREVQAGGYDVVTTQELKTWIDSKNEMIIIDAMPYDHYKKKHIPGALQFLFPIPDMDEWDPSLTEGKTTADYEALLGSDKQKPIVVYCGFVKCTRSHNAAIWARQLGYTNVYRHPGGIYAWEGADYTIESVD